MTKKVTLRAIGMTDVGRVRSTNQDSYLTDEKERLFIVADGMGGHAGGEIASQLAIKNVADFLEEHKKDFCDDPKRAHPNPKLQALLADAINYASAKIYDRALEEPSLKGMGTTVTLMKVIDNYAYVAHVGDSRLYLVRAGFNYQMTLDHSLVSEQVRAGLISEEEAHLHHLRNVITRSVGYQEEEYVDTYVFELEDQDTIIICSDGLHGKLEDAEIANYISTAPNSCVKDLIDEANARGGDDNTSVIAIFIQVS
ncbi:MAG: Stp1/IreP family PP2C-type Ser/Thr phosphatase [Bdellovibrionota bacterium]